MSLPRTEIDEYTERMTTEPPAALQELSRKTLDERDDSNMLSGRMVSGLLAMLVHATSARRVLEVGTFTGYATLTMAQALVHDDARVTTIEYNADTASRARETFAQIEGGDRIDVVVGAALDVLPTLDGPWDVVFLDAVKEEYGGYLDAVLPQLSPNGIVAVDNTLWSGRVLDADGDDATTRSIDAFNRSVAADERVIALQVPLRDGVTLIRRR